MNTGSRALNSLSVIHYLASALTSEPAGRMAAAAIGAESAAVHVVLLVACAADRADLWRAVHGLGVATVTIEADMGAGQWKLRLLVVIEARFQPAVRAVALRAIRPELALVERILVAGLALHRCILEIVVLMTVRTRYRLVLADQRKTRLVVIEFGDGLPIGDGVAALAIGAEFALMYVILLVAADAGDRQLDLVVIVLVAGIACDLDMRAAQGELGLVVVEVGRLLPGRVVVAALAFWPEPAFMHVVFLVTGDAAQRQLGLEVPALVAGIAGDLGVCAAQRKLRLVVIEQQVQPAFRLMAVLAFLTILALVHIVSLVTTDAKHRQSDQLAAGMTSPALGLGMGAYQREFCLAVIEAPADLFPIAGGMAIGAGGAQATLVDVVAQMAGVALLGSLAELLAGEMACLASEPDVSASQREVRLRMIEQGLIEKDHRGIAALVVGVATPALRGFHFGIAAMETNIAGDVGADRFMTIDA